MHNIIVTGGTRGLGLGIASFLAKADYRVIAVARKISAEFTETEHPGAGELYFQPADLADLDAIPDLVKTIRKEFGPIYGLVNNAGIGTSGLLVSMHVADIEHLVRLNTVSPMILTKHVIRAMMLHQDGGRIINMSSIVASTGFNGLSVYAATKASLIGFTKSLAREVGPLGITVNAVAPGFVDTSMTTEMSENARDRVLRRSPFKRLAEIPDIAVTVAFLMSKAARNITGTVVTVDAGSTA
jgi:3-oxoacyl-[acyl-carrier protein] reductase